MNFKLSIQEMLYYIEGLVELDFLSIQSYFFFFDSYSKNNIIVREQGEKIILFRYELGRKVGVIFLKFSGIGGRLFYRRFSY